MPSRRQLLQASALASGLGALGLEPSLAFAARAAAQGPVYAYVGTYSDGGKPWRGGRGTRELWWTWVALGTAWLSWCTVDYGSAGLHVPLANLVPAPRAANVVGFMGIIAFCLALAWVRPRGWVLAALAGGLTGAVHS